MNRDTACPTSIYRWSLLICVSIASLENAPSAVAFLPTRQHTINLLVERPTFVILSATSESLYDPEEEVKRRLVRAKEVLQKSKAKLESRANKAASDEQQIGPAGAASGVPFFASKKVKTVDPQRRERVIKARDDKTGLVRADGEKMAAMSEQEEWQVRSLYDLFENEMSETADVYSPTSQQLAERDLVVGVWNLRKIMKTEDYMKIFDKKNWFIGEDT